MTYGITYREAPTLGEMAWAEAAYRAGRLWQRKGVRTGTYVLLTLVVTVVALAIPRPALADPLSIIVDGLLTPFEHMLEDGYAAIINGVANVANEGFNLVNKQIPHNAGTGAFNPKSTDVTLSGFGKVVKGTSDAFNTISYQILGIVFGIQFIKEVQRPDNGPGNVPYVERFAMLWVKFAILKILVDKSLDLSISIFNTIQGLTYKIPTYGADVKLNNGQIKAAVDGALGIGGAAAAKSAFGFAISKSILFVIVLLLIMFVIAFILGCIVYLSVYGRWIQLWVYLCFAPIFFAFAGLDETRPMFMSYMKSIFGCGLAFVITAVLLKSMAPVIGGMFSASTQGALGLLLSTIAVEILYMVALMKCGSWAHDLIGG